jgi:tetratricopeptide (TPR) repeat protein
MSNRCGKRVQIQANSILIIVLLTLCPPLGVLGAQSEAWIADHLQTAAIALREHRYEEAIRNYQLVVNALPQNAELLSNLGIAYHLNGNYLEAIATFKKALSKKPDLVAANLFLGIGYLKLNESSKAISALQQALHLDSKNAEARLALGTALLSQRHYLEAIRELRIAAQAVPDNPEAWYQLGKAYLKLGDDAASLLRELDPNRLSLWARFLVAEVSLGAGKYRLAERELKKLATEYPSLLGVRSTLGELYLAEGRNTEAEEQFKEELRIQESNLEALYGLIQIALVSEDPQVALAYVERIVRLRPAYLTYKVSGQGRVMPEDKSQRLINRLESMSLNTSLNAATSHFLRAFLYSQVGNLEAAARHLKMLSDAAVRLESQNSRAAQEHLSACSTDPRNPERRSSRILASSCLYYLGAYEESLAVTDAVIASQPQSLPALLWRAKASKELAVLAFQRLAASDRDSFRVHQLQGQIYAANSQFEESREAYQNAIGLKPSFPALYLELGMIYRDQQQYDVAIPTVRKALELSPNDPETNYVLGEAYFKTNDRAQAMVYLKRAIELDPIYLQARLALGKAYREEGRFNDAAMELSAALPLDRNGEIHYQLSNIYRQLGLTKEARQEVIAFQRIREERLAANRQKGIYGLD